jgi:hypothetical protein
MLRHGKILVCILSGLVVCMEAEAVPNAPGNPYQIIPARNVFNLKKEQPKVIEEPPVPLPKIMLTGITTLHGLKRAVLQVQAPARAGAAVGEESYILAEGQRDRDIEVLQIDEEAGVVKIKTGGVPVTLDFVSNGIKPPALPPTGAAVPGPQTPTQSVAVPYSPPANIPPAPQTPAQPPQLPQ